MRRKIFTSISLTIAIGCMMASPVQASNTKAHCDPVNLNKPPLIIGGKWLSEDLEWLPTAIHDLICGIQ